MRSKRLDDLGSCSGKYSPCTRSGNCYSWGSLADRTEHRWEHRMVAAHRTELDREPGTVAGTAGGLGTVEGPGKIVDTAASVLRRAAGTVVGKQVRRRKSFFRKMFV